jgi:hypothetical protein
VNTVFQNLSSFIFPALALVIALWLLGFFFLSLLRFIQGDFREISGRFRLKRKRKLLVMADSLVERQEYASAIPLLKGAMMLDELSGSEQFIEQIHQHNLFILARLAALSETIGQRIDNLPLIEELLLSRGELLRMHREVYVSHQSFKARRQMRGANKATWADDGFSKKIADLLERLETNRRSIDAQCDLAFQQILSPKRNESEITYH